MRKNFWKKTIALGAFLGMTLPLVFINAQAKESKVFSVMTIDSDSLSMDVDGKNESFAEKNGLTRKRAKGILQSEDSLETYMNSEKGDHIYEVAETEDGIYEVTAPYQKKELIIPQEYVSTILTDDSKKDLGIQAGDIEKDTKTGNVVVSFDSEEETQKVLNDITEAYGEESCFSNEVLYAVTLDNESEEVIISPDQDVDELSTEEVLAPSLEGSEEIAVNLTSYAPTSWGNSYMGMNLLKDKPIPGGNPQITVAVVDTGADSSNSLFAGGRISPASYNFYSRNANIRDTHGHGTHISGIIADATPANVKILALKILNQDGYTSVDTVLNALSYAIDQNVAGINFSLSFSGAGSNAYNALNNMISKAYARGIPVCVAAGNESQNVAGVFPANNANTIAVSAINSQSMRPSFSNYGNGIDFCAPGVSIKSAGLNGAFATMSGTSMAAPHILAAVAYLKLLQPSLSVPGINKELMFYSKDLGNPGFDIYYGYGCPTIGNLYRDGIVYSGEVINPTLTAIYNTAKGIGINWTRISGASGYYIYRKAGTGAYKKLASVSANASSYTDKKASVGKYYTYKVVVSKGGAAGASSNPMGSYRLGKVTGLKAKNKKAGSLTVGWSKSKKVSGYQIQLSRYKSFVADVATFGSAKKSITVRPLAKGTWYMRVRSYKNQGALRFYSCWTGAKKIIVKK